MQASKYRWKIYLQQIKLYRIASSPVTDVIGLSNPTLLKFFRDFALQNRYDSNHWWEHPLPIKSSKCHMWNQKNEYWHALNLQKTGSIVEIVPDGALSSDTDLILVYGGFGSGFLYPLIPVHGKWTWSGITCAKMRREERRYQRQDSCS
jgi:hypothetical protein